MLDHSECVFAGLDDYNALNKIENKNYDLEYYVSKETLNVTFAEELKDETETQGGGSQTSKSDHPSLLTKGQVESKANAISGSSASDLECCLEFPSGHASSGGFDDNLTIEFTPSILHSLNVQTLVFLDKNKMPQSRLPPKDSAMEAPSSSNQGQPSKSTKE